MADCIVHVKSCGMTSRNGLHIGDTRTLAEPFVTPIFCFEFGIIQYFG